jgi:hypothetical protein
MLLGIEEKTGHNNRTELSVVNVQQFNLSPILFLRIGDTGPVGELFRISGRLAYVLRETSGPPNFNIYPPPNTQGKFLEEAGLVLRLGCPLETVSIWVPWS